MKLYQKILIGLAAGFVCGIFLGDKAELLKPVGDIFIRLLRMIVVPLVLATLITGVNSSGSIRKVGRLAFRTMGYFVVTTTLAVVIGLVLANIVDPGAGLQLGDVKAIKKPEPVTVAKMIVEMFPVNPLEAMAKGSVLQIIVFALLFGAALSLAQDRGKPVADFFAAMSDVMFKLSDLVIRAAPYGVFALIAWTAGKYGLAILMPMLKLIFTVFLGCLIHVFFTYTIAVGSLARVNPLHYFKKVLEPAIVGFSTCSAAAAFPLTMRAQQHLGVSPRVSGFVLPLALTINMDGTALYQAVCAVFVASAFGLQLTLSQQLTVVITAVLASIGTASIPGGGLIMLTLVLESVGLPLEGIAIVAGIDRVLDMFRTTTNVLGDNSSGLVVAALEGDLDRETASKSIDEIEALNAAS